MLQNHDLHIDVTINGSWWCRWDTTFQHGNIVLFKMTDSSCLSCQVNSSSSFLSCLESCEHVQGINIHIVYTICGGKNVHCTGNDDNKVQSILSK